MRVNRPCGWSFARFSFQRPVAAAQSDESGVISRSENLSVPIFARLGYFFLYRSHTVCQPRLIVSSETKTVDGERAYPFMKPPISARFPRKHSGLCLKDGANLRDCGFDLLRRSRDRQRAQHTKGYGDRTQNAHDPK